MAHVGLPGETGASRESLSCPTWNSSNEKLAAGEEIACGQNGISNITVLRRLSYTNFDLDSWKTTVAGKLPVASAGSTDLPAADVDSFRPEPEVPLNSNFPLTRSGRNSVLDVRRSKSRTADLNKLASMFSEEYRMKMISTKDHPYKHLQTSSSVESNDATPADTARRDSPSTTGNRLTASRANFDEDQIQSISSNLTVISTVSIQRKNDLTTKTVVSHSRRREGADQMQFNEGDQEDQPPELPYYPHSPQISRKPMVFERGPSTADSGNLLRVPAASAPRNRQSQNSSQKQGTGFDGTAQSNNVEGGDVHGADSRSSTPRKGGRGGRNGHVPVDTKTKVDFILVYEHGQAESYDRQRQYFEKNLQHEGLILESDTLDSDDSGKLCFIRVHAPWATLCRFAEMLQMKMPLRNAELPDCQSVSIVNDSSCLGAVKEFLRTHLFDFNDTERILIGERFSHVTAQFTRSRLDKFLINDPETFFTPTQRIRIVYEIMQKARCDPDDGKKRGLQWLIKRSVYLAAYPPHDGEADSKHLSTNEPGKWTHRQILKHTWASFDRLFKPQPLHLIRAYFGEKIGFYFAWLGFYTQMLIFPSIVGVVCFLAGVFSLSSNPLILEICSEDDVHDDVANVTMCPVCRLPHCRPWVLRSSCESAHWNYRFDNESHVVIAIFTLLWATVFMELWKRKEAELAAEWDAYDAEQGDEPMRPEYEAHTKSVRISPVTNEEEPYLPPCRRYLRLAASAAGVFLLILCVVAALMTLIIVRIALYGMLYNWGGIWAKHKFEIASLIVHVFTFVVVMTLGSIYEPTAHRLTEFECPRTQADYLSSYIWKVFIFELLNNFIPILYAALIRGRVSLPHQQNWVTEMCDPGGCLNEVVQAVAVLLLARLLISNAAELGVPFLKSLLKSKGLTRAAVHPDQESDQKLRNIPRWQRDYALNQPVLDGVYAEYLEMMVQFGYVTLFIAAFPLAPLICLLNNIIEVRLDATNFVTSFRRPLPSRVSGIRIWKTCLNIILKLSVLCNGAFLAFTSEMVPTLVYRYMISSDGSTKGYVWWSMAAMNTTDWPEYLVFDPNSTVCYYRDFRHPSNARKLIWWQLMVARLIFFVAFVITFYFIQWLCDFLVPDVPKHVKLKIERANFVARQALYGRDTAAGRMDSRTSLIQSKIPRQSARSDFTLQTEVTTSSGHRPNSKANGHWANGTGRPLPDVDQVENGSALVSDSRQGSHRPRLGVASIHMHPHQLPTSPI